ncbi:hypothetical protein ACPCHT_05420 [Nucisporomicrobium flavum]|uniref:hypothetical protein n=1 Tax=Nucisporomicrobium flavum TaxID=2785915 RepID=UPI0018F39D13|nr:hypothetical protein [Nucisporomicrobium flavum]
MSDLPAERDLPPGRADRMRDDLLRATRERPRRARRWMGAAVATVLTLVAAGAVVAHVRDEPGVQVLAMGPGELDGTLRRAADECLGWAGRDGGFRVRLGLGDLAVSARQGDRAAVLFLSGAGYAACDFVLGDRESSGGINAEPWEHRDWLPGPVQRLSLSSSEADGGAVSVLGRVSARVHRLVLEHGRGRTTDARLRDGAFGIVTRTSDVREDAELVSYDAAGREIDRRPLFPGPRRDENCWTDPAGTVIYGTLGGTCRPAERWNR